MNPQQDMDERVGAYIDGELKGEARAAFEREMAADPQLAGEVARHRALVERIAGAYAPVLEEPVPLRLFSAAKTADRPRRFSLGPPHWAAMAACLVAGVLVGRVAAPDRSPLQVTGAGLAVRGEIARALSANLSVDEGPVRVGFSFRTADGRYCRTFRSAPDRLAGLACRAGDEWLVRTTAEWAPGPEPEYRTAGVELPAAVLTAVEEFPEADLLDAAAERAARDRGWRP